MRAALCGLAAAVLCLGSWQTPCEEVSGVQIHTHRAGEGFQEYDIRCGGSSCLSGSRSVSCLLVRDLYEASLRPVFDGPELRNMGVSREWLETVAVRALDRYAPSLCEDMSEDQEQLFRRQFTDVTTIDRVVSAAYAEEVAPHPVVDTGWPNDYPSLSVLLTTVEGGEVRVESTSTMPFMLPWTVRMAGQTFRTYNADIAATLAALLPEGFANRERLTMAGFERFLAWAVFQEISSEWDALEVQKRLKADLDVLRREYELSDMRLESESSLFLESPIERLVVRMRVRGAPLPVYVGASLSLEGDRVKDIGEVMAGLRDCRELILSIPWLSSELTRHEDVELEIAYGGDRSMSYYQIWDYEQDMAALGRKDLARLVGGYRRDKCLLKIIEPGAWSQWIALSDRRMILWRLSGDRTLRWTAEALGASEGRSPSYRIAVAVVSKKGRISEP